MSTATEGSSQLSPWSRPRWLRSGHERRSERCQVSACSSLTVFAPRGVPQAMEESTKSGCGMAASSGKGCARHSRSCGREKRRARPTNDGIPSVDYQRCSPWGATATSLVTSGDTRTDSPNAGRYQGSVVNADSGCTTSTSSCPILTFWPTSTLLLPTIPVTGDRITV